MTLIGLDKQETCLHVNTLYVQITMIEGRYQVQAYCFTRNGGLLEPGRVARLQPRHYLPPRPMMGFRFAAHVPLVVRRTPVWRAAPYTLASEAYASDRVSNYMRNQEPAIVAALTDRLLAVLIKLVVCYAEIGVKEIHTALWKGRFKNIVLGKPVPPPRPGLAIVEELFPQSM